MFFLLRVVLIPVLIVVFVTFILFRNKSSIEIMLLGISLILVGIFLGNKEYMEFHGNESILVVVGVILSFCGFFKANNNSPN